MNTTTKPTEQQALPKRNAKTGRFEKAATKPTKAAKPAAEKAKKS